MRGTELHTKAASLTALHDNRNTSFGHESPRMGVKITPGVQLRRIQLWGFMKREGVMAITDWGEAEHESLLTGFATTPYAS